MNYALYEKKIWQIFVFNILLFFINNFREKKLKANEDEYKNKNNAKQETTNLIFNTKKQKK